jgi:hypothetical protein
MGVGSHNYRLAVDRLIKHCVVMNALAPSGRGKMENLVHNSVKAGQSLEDIRACRVVVVEAEELTISVRTGKHVARALYIEVEIVESRCPIAYR